MAQAKGVEFFIKELLKNYNVIPINKDESTDITVDHFKKLIEEAMIIEIKNVKSSYSSGYTNAIYSE